MPWTVGDLARAIGAACQGGDPRRPLSGAASLADAGPGDVAPLTDPRYAHFLPQTRAAAVILKLPPPPAGAPPETALLACADPELAFLKALVLLYPEEAETPGVDPRACVEAGAELGAGVYVGPFAVVRREARIGADSWILAGAYVGRRCRVGERCRIHPRAVLYDGVTLGNEVVVHAGTIVGADGFGYKFRDGHHVKVPQVGTVRVGNQVEIGANTCVDRGALGATEIGAGSKIDNLVQVGHNVRTGKHVILCGQAGVSGSVEIQDYAVLGANSGVADHLTIGTAARAGAKAGITESVPPHTEVFGYPAVPRRLAWRQFAALRKLPALFARIRALEKKLGLKPGLDEE